MKAGFWVAPEGADEAIAMVPIGGPLAEKSKIGVNGTGALWFLATSSAEEMIALCPGVAKLLPEIVAALKRQTANGAGILFDLGDLTDEEVSLVGEVMGEGEVAATVALPDGVTAQIRESVLAGLWRMRFTDANGVLIAEYAEVSAIPRAVRRAATMTLPVLSFGEAPEGAMNVMPVMPVMAEIRDRALAHVPGTPSHIISLSLLPMSPEDIEFLVTTLGTGPIRIVSKGYGTCRIQATAIHNVWSVQFFNVMDTILLDTIEIGDTPVVAIAAEEDFQDSAERLTEIEEAYFK